jgi:recombination protein RecA
MTKKKSEFLDTMREELDEAWESVLVTEANDSKIEVIPTSSISLNVSTGIGGIPKRRATEIYGAESSGKTTLVLDICKNALAEGSKVLYIDVEHGVDYNYTHKIIGDYEAENFILLQPETAEQGLKLVEEAINSGEFGCIIVDSVGALAPTKEKEDELEDAHVSLLARILTPFSRRNTHALKVNNVAVVFVNQIRDKIGSYIRDFETPGGHAFKHLLSLRIYLSVGEKIKESDEIVGNQVKFLIKKNKMAPPYRSFQFPLIYGKGIDSARDTVEFANKLGIIKNRGPYYFFDDVQLGQGIANTTRTLFDNPELLDKVHKACYNVLNIGKETEEKEE